MPNTVQVRFAPPLGRLASGSTAFTGETASAAAPPASMPEPALLKRLVAKAVRATLRHGRVRDAEVSVALMDDAGIIDMNDRFLGHSGVTDVISFPLYDEGEPPVGDIYIGLEQALRQAASAGIDPAEEVVRLAVHGTLHVLGHDHPKGSGRTESEMWRLQEQIVADVVA
jgi:probable rRNA maturation factor